MMVQIKGITRMPVMTPLVMAPGVKDNLLTAMAVFTVATTVVRHSTSCHCIDVMLFYDFQVKDK